MKQFMWILKNGNNYRQENYIMRSCVIFFCLLNIPTYYITKGDKLCRILGYMGEWVVGWVLSWDDTTWETLAWLWG